MVGRMKKLLMIAMVLALPGFASGENAAGQIEVELEPKTPGQGEIVLVTVKNARGPVEGTFQGREVYFNPSRDSVKAMVGINLYAKPGKYHLTLSADGKTLERTITVKKKHYPVMVRSSVLPSADSVRWYNTGTYHNGEEEALSRTAADIAEGHGHSHA